MYEDVCLVAFKKKKTRHPRLSTVLPRGSYDPNDSPAWTPGIFEPQRRHCFSIAPPLRGYLAQTPWNT